MKRYLDLTIGSVALTLLEGCFYILDNTLRVGTDTFTGCFDTFDAFFEYYAGAEWFSEHSVVSE